MNLFKFINQILSNNEDTFSILLQGYRIDPWITGVWIAQVHLYVIVFQNIEYYKCTLLIFLTFSFFSLFCCKHRVYKTYTKYVNQLLMLSVRLPINSRLLIAKFWGESKIICRFSIAWDGVGRGCQRLHCLRVNYSLKLREKREKKNKYHSNIYNFCKNFRCPHKTQLEMRTSLRWHFSYKRISEHLHITIFTFLFSSQE